MGWRIEHWLSISSEGERNIRQHSYTIFGGREQNERNDTPYSTTTSISNVWSVYFSDGAASGRMWPITAEEDSRNGNIDGKWFCARLENGRRVALIVLKSRDLSRWMCYIFVKEKKKGSRLDSWWNSRKWRNWCRWVRRDSNRDRLFYCMKFCKGKK